MTAATGERMHGYMQTLKSYVPVIRFDLSTQRWLRLFLIIGAYLVLRPLLVKWMARSRGLDHENPSAASEKPSNAAASPNDSRGQAVTPKEPDKAIRKRTTTTPAGDGKAKQRERDDSENPLRAEDEDGEWVQDRDLEELVQRL